MHDNRIKTPREQLKSDIDSCIKTTRDYDAFIALMKAKGYEIKGAELGSSPDEKSATPDASSATADRVHTAKYIAFKPIGSAQYIRGCERSLGKGYSREEIWERILKKREESEHRKIEEGRDNRHGSAFNNAAHNAGSAQKHSQPEKDTLDSLRISSFIDITKQKFADNTYLKDWAKLQNLKLAAKEYSDIGSLSRLQEELDLKKNIIRETKSTIAALDRKKKVMGEALMYAQEFLDNQAAFEAHEQADNVEKWLRGNSGDNERRYILFLGAREWLEKNGFNLRKIDLEKMKTEFAGINEKRDKLKNEAAGMEKDVRRIEGKIKELNDYLGQKNVADLQERTDKRGAKTQENKGL